MPSVTVEDVAVPFWARRSIAKARDWLGRPDCLLTVWIHYPSVIGLVVLPLPHEWASVAFSIDGEDPALLPSDDEWSWLTVGLTAGRHVIGIEPAGGEGMVESVALELERGTVVLVEVRPKNYRWIGRRPPSVTYRVLPAGFARNGQWGERWNRRLGWDGPPLDPGDAAPQYPKVAPPPAQPLVPVVEVGSGWLPRWARRAIGGARRDLEQPSCLVAARIRHVPPGAQTVSWQWGAFVFLFGASGAVTKGVVDGSWGFAAGVAAGSVTFEVRPWDKEGWVEPVTLELERGTVVLIDVWPQSKRWVSRRAPSVSLRVLPSALSGGGWWEARWRRRLGWEDLNRPSPPLASDGHPVERSRV